MLLQCASPDAIARLPATELKFDADEICKEYFKKQKHGSLKDYLIHCLRINENTEKDGALVQVSLNFKGNWMRYFAMKFRHIVKKQCFLLRITETNRAFKISNIFPSFCCLTLILLKLHLAIKKHNPDTIIVCKNDVYLNYCFSFEYSNIFAHRLLALKLFFFSVVLLLQKHLSKAS